MSDRQLPAGTAGGITPFDPRVSSPIVRRGLDRLTAIMAVPRTPVHLWTYRGYGAKNGWSTRRPTTAPVRMETIPAELIERPQWICWDWAWPWRRGDGKRWRKSPLSPITGGTASELDPRTWSSFDQACDFATQYQLPGIGFVLSVDDPFVGVVIDDCLDPETGELEAWADDIVRDLDSYTEVSPTGRGVQVLVQGLPSEEERSWYGVQPEVLDRECFLPLTGHHLSGTLQTIRHRQSALGRLDRWPSESASDWLSDMSLEFGERSIGQFVVLDDTVVVHCWDGNLHALDVATGTERWQLQADGMDAWSHGDHDVVCVESNRHTLHALDVRTRAHRWAFRVDENEVIEDVWANGRIVCVQSWDYDDRMEPNVALLDASTGAVIRRFDQAGSWIDRRHTLFIRDLEGYLHALDPAGGHEKWRANVGRGRSFGLASNEVERSVFGVSGNAIFSVDLTNGSVRWVRELPSHVNSDILAHPETGTVVYKIVDEEGLFALNAENGEDRWHFPDSTLMYTHVSTSKTLFAMHKPIPNTLFAMMFATEALCAVDMTSGRERWRFHASCMVSRQPQGLDDDFFDPIGFDDWFIRPESVIHGRVYIASRAHDIEVISVVDEEHGTLLWEATGHLLRVTNGLVYAGKRDGCLVALNAETGAEEWRISLLQDLQNDLSIDSSFLWGISYDVWSQNWFEYRREDPDQGQSLYLGKYGGMHIQQGRLFIATDHVMHAFRLS